MAMAENPYATPEAALESSDVTRAAESIRQAHINHEASVRSIGLLYYLSATMFIIGIIVTLVSIDGEEMVVQIGLALGMLVLTAGMVAVGRGLRMLKPWARIVAIVFAVLGLLGFPIGTLINAYILYLVLCAKGQRVFAQDYQDIIAQTPQIKYRTSIVVWIFLALLAAFILLGLVSFVMGG